MEEKLIAMETVEMTRDEIKDLKEVHKESRIPRKKSAAVVRLEAELAEALKAEKPEVFTQTKSPSELRAMPYDKRMKYFEWCRQRDKEKVKGVFRNFENPGVELSFVYLGWKGDGYQTVHMMDGETYDIERGIERHINTNCWYPQYEHVPGGKIINVPGEKPTNMRIGRKVKRFAFQVIDSGYDYNASEALSPIVFVEHIGQSNLVGR